MDWVSNPPDMPQLLGFFSASLWLFLKHLPTIGYYQYFIPQDYKTTTIIKVLRFSPQAPPPLHLKPHSLITRQSFLRCLCLETRLSRACWLLYTNTSLISSVDGKQQDVRTAICSSCVPSSDLSPESCVLIAESNCAWLFKKGDFDAASSPPHLLPLVQNGYYRHQQEKRRNQGRDEQSLLWVRASHRCTDRLPSDSYPT